MTAPKAPGADPSAAFRSDANTALVDLARPRALLYLGAIWIAAALLRAFVNFVAVTGPRIFGDEMEYMEFARSFLRGHELQFGRVFPNWPCWLYPLTIAPLMKLPVQEAYFAIRCLNALMMTSAALVAYGLAREVSTRRTALKVAALTTLLAGGAYSATVMTENLFFPAFLLGAWALVRAFSRPSVLGRFLAGLAMGLSFHVKPQALLLPLIAAATAFVLAVDRLRNTEPGERRLRQFTGGLFAHIVTAAGWATALTPRLLEMASHHRPLRLTAAGFLGGYFGGLRSQEHVSVVKWAFSSASYMVVAAVAMGILPAFVCARDLLPSRWRLLDRRLKILLVLSWVSLAAFALTTARYSLLADSSWRIHERYFFVTLPPFLAFFAARLEHGLRREVLPRAAYDSFLVGLPVLALLFSHPLRWTLGDDSPSLTAFFLTLSWRSIPVIGLLLVLGSFCTGLGFLARGVGNPNRAIAGVALLLFCYNSGWYLGHAYVWGPRAETANRNAKELARTVGENRPLILLVDGADDATWMRLVFWHETHLVCADSGVFAWATEKLVRAGDGYLVRNSGPAAVFAAAEGWAADRPAMPSTHGFNLFDLPAGGSMRVRRRSPEAVDHTSTKEGPSIGTATGVREFEASYRPVEILKIMKSGSATGMVVEVRNEGTVIWPAAGAQRVAFGYYWADPEHRGGSWKPVRSDDGARGTLSADVAPGSSGIIRLDIRALDRSARHCKLVMQPIIGGVTWVGDKPFVAEIVIH